MSARANPAGKAGKDGACNEPVDVGLAIPYYCHRPDNGSGFCNIHEAAKERGRKRRTEAAALARLRWKRGGK